jgi:hypothetical protein
MKREVQHPKLPPGNGRAGARCFRIFLCLTAILLIMAPGRTIGQTQASKEYQIKAAFLFNFVQFIEWPPTAFTNATAPFRIGVLGENPFGQALEEIVKNESIRNRSLVIKYSRRVEDMEDCQLVFIGKSEKGRLAELLPKLNFKEKLIVSEIEGFARRGGMINFYLEGSKVRFEINQEAAQREGLKISSQLLSLARIIKSEPLKEVK